MLSSLRKIQFGTSKLAVIVAAASLATLLAATTTARAELIVGLTIQNSLISFDSATPGTVNTIGANHGADRRRCAGGH